MIKLGRVAPGAQAIDPDDKGVNITLRGTVHFLDEHPVEAYIKFLSTRQLVNELICSVLAKQLELKVPRAFLVVVDRMDYPDAPMFVGNDTTEQVAFAVESLAHPSLIRRLKLEGDHWQQMLKAHWKGWTTAAAFDELIANRDRHGGNLLVGAADDVWLIDHTHALTGEAWSAEDLTEVGHRAVENKLARLLGYLLQPGEASEQKPQAEALQAKALTLDYVQSIQTSWAGALMTSEDSFALASFLNARSGYIAKNVCAHYGPTLL